MKQKIVHYQVILGGMDSNTLPKGQKIHSRVQGDITSQATTLSSGKLFSFFHSQLFHFLKSHHYPRINNIKRLDEIRLNVLSISIFNFMSAVNKKLIR